MKYMLSLLTFVISGSLSAAEKKLNIGIIQEWSAFNPVISQLASNEALFPFILRQMVQRGADGGVLPDVAESVPALKGKMAVWTIRQNAKWADGHEITCADWHLGWSAGLNPKVSVLARTFYSKISDITWDEKKPKVCHVTYSTPDWSYDRDLPSLLPAHIEKPTYEKFKNEPEGYDRNTAYISAPTNPGLYNGPYYVSEFVLGSHVILSPNRNFFGSKPKISKIIVKYISDTSALKAHLMSGQINAISAVGFPPDTALMFADEFKKGGAASQVRFQSSGIFQGVYFNLQNEILRDPKVREALSRAIDKKKIAAAFFNGHLPPAEGILSPQHPAYREIAPIYSPKTAARLLDDAGWKTGADGIRTKNGKRLEFIFKTSAGLKVLENIQLAICDGFKSVGVSCAIKNEPPRILLGRSVPQGEFDLAMYGQPIPPDTSISSYFSSKEIPTAQNSWAGGNAIRLNSPELDQLLNAFDKEKNKTKRNQIMTRIDAYFRRTYSLIPLYHRREAIVVPKNLGGLRDSYEGTAFASPENWSW